MGQIRNNSDVRRQWNDEASLGGGLLRLKLTAWKVGSVD